jgi:CubicO group peptidase (beta-lactamase class C family)
VDAWPILGLGIVLSPALHMPNTLDTRFDTASVTKLFTAIATLQLIDRGLLAFDDQDIAVTLLSNMEDDV